MENFFEITDDDKNRITLNTNSIKFIQEDRETNEAIVYFLDEGYTIFKIGYEDFMSQMKEQLS